MKNNSVKSVFVTYASDSENNMNDKVHNFVMKLQAKGVPSAKYDKIIDEDDINLKMKIGLGSDRVIIILSEKYKKKVDNKEGNVITEWGTVLRNYSGRSEKYIFVCFDKDLSDKTILNKISPETAASLGEFGNSGNILVYNINFESNEVKDDFNLDVLLYRIDREVFSNPEKKN